MPSLPTLGLVTPARNEARFIELTIQSVIRQTARPARWVIVNDGSTDGTDDIVKTYQREHAWIEQIVIPNRHDRQFAGKARAFNEGYAAIKHLRFDVIGCLDADISFDADYFRFLLEKLAAHRDLGLVGSALRGSPSYDYRFVSIEHVSGSCQLFRRECLDQIGGYAPVPFGGVDHIAAISARMNGWKTRTFTEKTARHHREMGSAAHGSIAAKLRIGVIDYALGSHPLWECCRTLYQMTRPPLILGGLAIFGGYVWAAITRAPRTVSPELVAFRRREQMQRLKHFFFGISEERPA